MQTTNYSELVDKGLDGGSFALEQASSWSVPACKGLKPVTHKY